MIGTRNIAFPRLNAFAYWLYLVGGLLLFGAFVSNMGPDAGWFAYVPLAGPAVRGRQAGRHLGQMITFTEVVGAAGGGRYHRRPYSSFARPGMSLRPDAAVRVGVARHVRA